jgi:hypothetical protein
MILENNTGNLKEGKNAFMYADAAEADMVDLSLSPTNNPSRAHPADQPAQLRTVAANGQPRKVLQPNSEGSPAATAEGYIPARPAPEAGVAREVHRTASNGQPRKIFLSCYSLDSHGRLRNASFRNR